MVRGDRNPPGPFVLLARARGLDERARHGLGSPPRSPASGGDRVPLVRRGRRRARRLGSPRGAARADQSGGCRFRHRAALFLFLECHGQVRPLSGPDGLGRTVPSRWMGAGADAAPPARPDRRSRRCRLKQVHKALLLGVVQLALVASLGGKFLADRASRPRFWLKTAPVDPDLPIRGRYVSLRVEVPAPGLGAPSKKEEEQRMSVPRPAAPLLRDRPEMVHLKAGPQGLTAVFG